jgi:hypothetical protein
MERLKEGKVRQASETAQKPNASKSEGQEIRISRQVETCPFSFQKVLLSLNGIQAESDVQWKPYSQEQGQGYGNKNKMPGPRRTNSARVGAMSRRLMRLERARALGRTPADPRKYRLELEARRWAEERARRELSATRGG